jgi:hypothetical protein
MLLDPPPAVTLVSSSTAHPVRSNEAELLFPELDRNRRVERPGGAPPAASVWAELAAVIVALDGEVADEPSASLIVTNTGNDIERHYSILCAGLDEPTVVVGAAHRSSARRLVSVGIAPPYIGSLGTVQGITLVPIIRASFPKVLLIKVL